MSHLYCVKGKDDNVILRFKILIEKSNSSDRIF